MRGLITRIAGQLRPVAPEPPTLSFGGWDQLDADVVTVCHPDWRGVRAAARGHGGPLIETRDAGAVAAEVVARLRDADVRVLVVHGFPPGSGQLIARAAASGLQTRLVLHASMAQHGGEAGEALVADEAVALIEAGVLHRLGFVKDGMAEAFGALGIAAHWVPNRAPRVDQATRLELGPGVRHIGVFAEPFWRKNVVTQLGAVALLPDARAHVLVRPEVGYLAAVDLVEHGVLPHERYLELQASVDLNLCVTLSESYPLSPLESYAAGVPCLLSRTSNLFRDDPELWALATVDEPDNPVAIARAAERLLHRPDETVTAARRWMQRWDVVAAQRWEAFTAG